MPSRHLSERVMSGRRGNRLVDGAGGPVRALTRRRGDYRALLIGNGAGNGTAIALGKQGPSAQEQISCYPQRTHSNISSDVEKTPWLEPNPAPAIDYSTDSRMRICDLPAAVKHQVQCQYKCWPANRPSPATPGATSLRIRNLNARVKPKVECQFVMRLARPAS